MAKKIDFKALGKDGIKAVCKEKVCARIERLEKSRDSKEGKKAYEAFNEKISKGERPTEKEFMYGTGIAFSNHGDDTKLFLMRSLSSCCWGCWLCVIRLLAGIGVCLECFAANYELMRASLFENTLYNGVFLALYILKPEMWPLIADLSFRFESFGDVSNWKMCANYFNFAIGNEKTRFVAWTKNPGFYRQAILHGYKKPKNFRLILSSQYLNVPANVPANCKDIIDKVFTVYTLDYILENNLDINTFINCGGKKCITCQNCYLNCDSSPFYINELLKSDWNRAKKLGLIEESVSYTGFQDENMQFENANKVEIFFNDLLEDCKEFFNK